MTGRRGALAATAAVLGALAAAAVAQGTTTPLPSVSVSIAGRSVASVSVPIETPAPVPASTVTTPSLAGLPAVGVTVSETSPAPVTTPQLPEARLPVTERSAAGESVAAAAATSGAPTSRSAEASSSAAATTASPTPRAPQISRSQATRVPRRRASRRAAASSAKALVTVPATRTHATTQVTRPARQVGVRRPAKSSGGGVVPLPLPVPDWSKPIILALALLAAAFGIRATIASNRARRLRRAHALLLEDVGALQAALMFEPPTGLAGVEVSVAYRPAEGPAAGGDFCDVFALSDTVLAVILGDVVGHGRGALRQAVLARYTVRAYLQTGMTPRASLALAGRALASPGCELLATVAVATLDLERGALTYALAGHPPPILTGVDVADPPLECSSPPLGWSAPTGRRQATITLPAGAAVCFFTDGLTEARCEGREGLLGHERLRAIITSLEPPGRADALLDAVRAAARATPDDMAACILTSRVQVPAPADVHAEELEIDASDLSDGRAQRFLAAAGVAQTSVRQALAEAGEVVRAHGGAVLHVDYHGDGVAVRVAAAAAQTLLPAGAGLDSELSLLA